MDNTVSAYESIETVYRKRKTEEFVNKFDPVSTNIEQVRIDRFLPEEDWKARELVINGLRQYSQSLKEIASNEKLDEFDVKTKALGEQLINIQSTTVKTKILTANVFTNKEINLFTAGINAIGRWFIDYKRKKVIRSTVNEMQEDVRNVCILFSKEIGKSPISENSPMIDTTQYPTLRKKLWKDYSDFLRIRNDFLRKNLNNLSANEQRDLKKELLMIKDEREKADNTLNAVVMSLYAIPLAHDNIEKAFDENDMTFMSQVANIFKEAQRIKNFYEGLKTE
ncbi:MAG: hypothetical protein AAB336_03390 [Acidobacteriota bacterium]